MIWSCCLAPTRQGQTRSLSGALSNPQSTRAKFDRTFVVRLFPFHGLTRSNQILCPRQGCRTPLKTSLSPPQFHKISGNLATPPDPIAGALLARKFRLCHDRRGPLFALIYKCPPTNWWLAPRKSQNDVCARSFRWGVRWFCFAEPGSADRGKNKGSQNVGAPGGLVSA